MKKAKYLILMAVIFIFAACNSDDSTNPEPQSEWTGSYKIQQETWSPYTDSLSCSFDLVETDGIITGTGSIYYTKTESGTTITVQFQDDVSGTLSSNTLSISVTGAGGTFTFQGTLKSQAEHSFEGNSVLNTGADTFTFESIIFKEE